VKEEAVAEATKEDRGYGYLERAESLLKKESVCTAQTVWRTMSQEAYVGGILRPFREKVSGFMTYLNRSHPPCSFG
jgi:hypothetical protein